MSSRIQAAALGDPQVGRCSITSAQLVAPVNHHPREFFLTVPRVSTDSETLPSYII